MKTLRFILGDQLSHQISSLSNCDKSQDIIFMCEVHEEATYVKHHKKKIAFLFSAMRHFAQSLRNDGYQVDYVTLDDAENIHSFTQELKRAVARHDINNVVITSPSEYRVLEAVKAWKTELSIDTEICEDDRFLCSEGWFKAWAKDRKQLRMEYFYREMRKKHNILISNDKPEGGEWNYDAENRKPPKSGLEVPAPFKTAPDDITNEVLELVETHFAKHFGDLEPFHFAVTRSQALEVLKHFIQYRLAHFGDYQDAMLQGEPWMYHSHISFYINCGLLLPKECIEAAVDAYHNKQAPLNAVEGFIRQILGWREFVRGIYWLKMPDYATENFFDARRKLPELFWSGNSKMNCLKQCVTETKENAYAHHIQRLMVIGNFALLAGLDVKAVNEWFLIVYADAFEWVEMPNVTGMSLFADGGVFASKPYAAGGNYINKMSDYCKGCSYKISSKTGDSACPFNYLYWDFLARNRSKLASNPRVGMLYKTYDRMGEEKQHAITQSSQKFLNEIQ